MKLTVLLMLAAVTLSGCGTLQGLLEGTGRAVEGVAQDLRSAGGMFRR
jgi:predicted small secreted protein